MKEEISNAFNLLVKEGYLTKESAYDMIVGEPPIEVVSPPPPEVTGAKKRGRKKSWTEEEEKFLRKKYANASAKEIAKRLGKTETAIRRMAERLELRKKEWGWTEEKDEFIKENYASMDKKQIAEKLGKTPAAVVTRAFALGVKKHPKQSKEKTTTEKPSKLRRWTSEDDDYLIVNHKYSSVEELAQRLRRTTQEINNRIYDLKKMDKIVTEDE